MGTDGELDLTDVEWPVCLLRFNETLKDRPSGSTLEVRSRDPRVVDSVKMIASNSRHKITRIEHTDDCYRICICKEAHLLPVSEGKGIGNE